MLVRKIIASMNQRSVACGGSRTTTLSFNTTASTLTTENTEEPPKTVRKLKEWRKMPESEPSFLKSLQIPRDKPRPLRLIRRPVKLSASDIAQWLSSKKVSYQKYEQRFQQERHETVGCDLAAAHFLVYRGGKVKFLDQREWKILREDGGCELPTKYDPTWKITHLDASEINLYYEGLENFVNLKYLVWASFRGNEHFDDWCLDRIAANFPHMEHLDVSECPKLTERGIEALYKNYSLKKLVVTNWDKTPSFELTCAMLEDCHPDLVVKILDPPKTIVSESF